MWGTLLGLFVAIAWCLLIYYLIGPKFGKLVLEKKIYFVLDDYSLIANRYDLVTYQNVFKVFECEARKRNGNDDEKIKSNDEEKQALLTKT